MKIRINVLALVLSASVAFAQTGAAVKPTTVPAKAAPAPSEKASKTKSGSTAKATGGKPTAAPKKAAPAATRANQAAVSAKPEAKASPAPAAAPKKAAPAKPVMAGAKAAKPATVAPKPAKTPGQTKAAAPSKPVVPAKAMETPFAKKVVVPAPKPEMKATAQENKPAAAVVAPALEMAKPYSSVGKRDPFISPIQVASTGAGACTGGKRCLIINQITLRGIVKSVNGWIAVVENPGQKTYFLRENDPVLNGFVSRISGDSVVFKENQVDALGHQTQREIVKHVSAPVV